MHLDEQAAFTGDNRLPGAGRDRRSRQSASILTDSFPKRFSVGHSVLASSEKAAVRAQSVVFTEMGSNSGAASRWLHGRKEKRWASIPGVQRKDLRSPALVARRTSWVMSTKAWCKL